MSSKIESLDSSLPTAPTVQGLDLEEKSEQTVTLYLADKDKKCIGSEHSLTHTQLSVSKLYFEVDEKTGKKKPNVEELEGKIPVDMTAWAGKYTVEDAEYALAKCVEWMKHYNGVSIPCWKGTLPFKPRLEEFWKDSTFAEDGKTPWCISWVSKIHESGTGCDKLFQVLLCANYFYIDSLVHLICCKIAAIMKGTKLKDLPAVLGVNFSNKNFSTISSSSSVTADKTK